jgi:hypothetical protein
MEHEIFGIAFNHEPQKVGDLFDCVRDADDEVVFETKQTYEHREEGLNFDYKFVIRAENAYELTGEPEDENMWHLELLLVPTIESLLPKKQKDLQDMVGEDGEPSTIDLIDEGSYVQFGFEAVKVDPDMGYDAVMLPKYDEAASVVDNVNAMRGFYLDKPWNRIGSTGWDILNGLVGNGKSFITAALDRWKESKK